MPRDSAAPWRRLVPALCALVLVGCSASHPAAPPASVHVQALGCATDWPTVAPAARQVLLVNTGTQAEELALLSAGNPPSAALYALVPRLSGGATRLVSLPLPDGRYRWRCTSPQGEVSYSPVRAAKGSLPRPATVTPVSPQQTTLLAAAYGRHVLLTLKDLDAAVADLQVAVTAQDGPTARARWVDAYLIYASLGTADGSFGDYAVKIDATPADEAAAPSDPSSTGFPRVEYLLWHRAPWPVVRTATHQLATEVHALAAAFGHQVQVVAGQLAPGAEQALLTASDTTLTGVDDHGSHSDLLAAVSIVSGVQQVLDVLAEPLGGRDPALLAQSRSRLTDLSARLDALRTGQGDWPPVTTLTGAQRDGLGSAMGALLETVARWQATLSIPSVQET